MSRSKKNKPNHPNRSAISSNVARGMILSGIGKAGPMKDRREPRGGAKNEQKELLEEVDLSYVCGKCGIGQDIFTKECLNCGALGTVIVDGGDLLNKEKDNTNE